MNALDIGQALLRLAEATLMLGVVKDVRKGGSVY
jgi:hypothetical protein